MEAVRDCKCDIKDIHLSFSFDYMPEEILYARNKLIKFYEGAMSVEYVNSLIIEEFIQENKIANRMADELDREMQSMKRDNTNGK